MAITAIEHEFSEKVSAEVQLEAEGTNRYRVFTPFRFDDGDHLVIVLKQEDGGWVLSDEAHTYMHLTYEMDEQDLRSGTRQRIIAGALSVFGVEDRDGELRLDVPNGQYGDALFSFSQALLRIAGVSHLSRERVKSAFRDDFKAALTQWVPDNRRLFDWHDQQRDPNTRYPVDCRVNGMDIPLFIHALNSDGMTRDATISLLQFEKWGLNFQSLAIFEDQEAISRNVLARFTDVCEKQCSSLAASRDRILQIVGEAKADNAS